MAETLAPGLGLSSDEVEIIRRDVERRQAPLPAGRSGVDVLTAVLCVLAQRVPGGDAGRLARAPGALGQRLEPCAQHRAEPRETFDVGELFRRVADHLGTTPDEGEGLTRDTLAALRPRLSAHVRDQVESRLPEDIARVWRDPEAGPTAGQPAGNRPAELKGTGQLADEVSRTGLLPPDLDADAAISGVLCVLAQRNDPTREREILKLLPGEIQVAMQQCPIHRSVEGPSDRQEFVSRVGLHLDIPSAAAEDVIRAVLRVVRGHLSPRAEQALEGHLPGYLRDLWQG